MMAVCRQCTGTKIRSRILMYNQEKIISNRFDSRNSTPLTINHPDRYRRPQTMAETRTLIFLLTGPFFHAEIQSKICWSDTSTLWMYGRVRPAGRQLLLFDKRFQRQKLQLQHSPNLNITSVVGAFYLYPGLPVLFVAVRPNKEPAV